MTHSTPFFVYFFIGYCGLQFPRKNELTRHVSDVHEQHKRYQCSICSVKFTRKNDCYSHIRDIHPKIKCTYCEEKFTTKTILNNHMESMHVLEISRNNHNLPFFS